MKHVTKDELLKAVLQENGALRSQLTQAQSNIDYIAMMSGTELESAETEEANTNEQVL